MKKVSLTKLNLNKQAKRTLGKMANNGLSLVCLSQSPKDNVLHTCSNLASFQWHHQSGQRRGRMCYRRRNVKVKLGYSVETIRHMGESGVC